MKLSSIYRELRDRAVAGIPDLYVEVNKDQLRNADQSYPLPLPALLIKFGNIRWSTTGGGVRIGEGSIYFSLYNEHLTDSHKGAEMEAHSLSLLDKADAIFQLFEGFALANMSALQRIGESEVTYGKRYMCTVTEFKTVFYDELASAAGQLTPATNAYITGIFKT